MERRIQFRKRESVAYTVLMFAFFSFSLFGGITLEPNGVILPGTTLTVRIMMPVGVKSVELEIVMDGNENGKAESHEKRTLNKTEVKDGETAGLFVDQCDQTGVIEFSLRISTKIQPGSYIIRFTPGSKDLPEGAVFEISSSSKGLYSWLKKHVIEFRQMIKDPAPNLPLVRGMDGKNEQIDKTNLWLMNGETFKIIGRLTDTNDCTNPIWSPDGKKIAYIRWVNHVGQLWVLELVKGKVVSKPKRILADFKESIENPLWSRKGEKIVFISCKCIWVTRADGSQSKQITEVEGIQKILAWTQDDGSIILSTYAEADTSFLSKDGKLFTLDNKEIEPLEKNVDIYKLDINSGKLERLAYDVVWLWLSYVSSDGSQLVFPIKNEHQLWLRKGEGFNDVELLTEGEYIYTEPSWSNDGKWIVFTSDRNK